MSAEANLERLSLKSSDIAEERRSQLLRIFPEVHTEGGKIDFAKLSAVLGQTVDMGKERYGMNWPGKMECLKTIQTPSLGTLRPVVDESVDFDTTENIFIEGDNLESLKLLQKAYLGKVKVIYIDPPYNTGKEFIYPDDYSESLRTYLQYTGQVDSEGKRFGTNTESDGRYHSRWLNMIYPRLYLARNLLADDGAIFITIDDHEVDNLRKCCYEIFGEENFVAQIEWQKRYTRSNNTDDFTSVIDHVVVFAKSDKFKPRLIEREEEANARYSNPDNDPRGPWKAIPFLNPLSPEERPNLVYPITHPRGHQIMPQKKAWRSEEGVWKKLVDENRVWWGKGNDSEVPNVKRFLSEVRQGMTPINFWSHEFAGHTDDANREIKEIFEDKVFDTPKPIRLIQRMIELVVGGEEDCIVLDFFAGSGTTGHAVLDMNSRDNGKRKYILIQLPEPTGRSDYLTIADIAKERLKRVGRKLKEREGGAVLSDDFGFKVFKLADSNFSTWETEGERTVSGLQRQLALHADHVRDGRSSEDIFFEILIKSGFPLATSVQKKLENKSVVFEVAGGSLMICLESSLSLDLIRSIAEKKPQRVVLLDKGFGQSDELKTNAIQIFRSKGVESFKTV